MKKTLLSVLALFFFRFSSLCLCEEEWLYFGGYSEEPNEEMSIHHIPRLTGIFLSKYDESTGKMTLPKKVADIQSPNFFVLSPDQRILYTCCGDPDNLAAFIIDHKTGALTPHGIVSNGGKCCTHLAISPDGKWLASANYFSGDFFVNRINDDGSIGDITARIYRFGTGSERDRQTQPYAHSTYFVQDQNGILRLFLVDLGTDRVFINRVDSQTGEVSDDPDIPVLYLPAGSGCRHLDWFQLPDGSFDIFVNNEINSTVSFFSLEFGKGSDGVTYWGTWMTLPEEYRNKVHWNIETVNSDPTLTLMNSTAEIVQKESSDGSGYIYVSNRGHNSIAVFKIVEKDGIRSLKPDQFFPTGGDSPRFFCFDTNKNHFIVANKRSGTIFTFKLTANGILESTQNPPITLGWPCAMALVSMEEED